MFPRDCLSLVAKQQATNEAIANNALKSACPRNKWNVLRCKTRRSPTPLHMVTIRTSDWWVALRRTSHETASLETEAMRSAARTVEHIYVLWRTVPGYCANGSDRTVRKSRGDSRLYHPIGNGRERICEMSSAISVAR